MLYVTSLYLPFHLTFQENIARLILISGLVQANIYFVSPSFCLFSFCRLQYPIPRVCSYWNGIIGVFCCCFSLPRVGLLSNHFIFYIYSFISKYLLHAYQVQVITQYGTASSCTYFLPVGTAFCILYFSVQGTQQLLKVLTLGSYRDTYTVFASWQLYDLWQIITFLSLCFFTVNPKGWCKD